MITPEAARQFRRHAVECWINRLDEQLQSEMEQREGPYVLRAGDAKPQEVEEEIARRGGTRGCTMRRVMEKGE